MIRAETGQGIDMLSVRNVSKHFGDIAANDDVSLTIKPGEIHALLGENGAGKSTLVKMLYGSLQPDAGSIFWKGEEVTITSPFEARTLGIGMVFQHFSLFDALRVADNIALSLDTGNKISTIANQAVEFSKKYGLPLNPDNLVGDLSVGERQRVEIIRCLLQNPELIILDEPTSVLTPQEAESLFETLDILKSEGRSVLFISHRLEEVRRLCDTATILRAGKVVAECIPAKETAASIAKMMVGTSVANVQKSKALKSNPAAMLELNNVTLPASRPFAVALKDINLKVFAGEIVGIAGVAGNGQSELFEAVSGERKLSDDASITIRDMPVGKKDINKRRTTGAAFVPEERLGHGAVSIFHLTDNMLLARHQSDKVAFQWGRGLGIIWQELVQKATTRVCDMMDVRKPSINPVAASLSGGNLQKFIVGRELDRQPSLLVINQPSWGVDANAASNIRQSLIDLAAAGSAILVISQDLDEIFELSDRIAVMYDGRLSEPVQAASITREEIGLLMTGMTVDEASDAA